MAQHATHIDENKIQNTQTKIHI